MAWRERSPQRDITVYRGEDIDLAFQLSKDGVAWVPPDGTTAFWRVHTDPVQDIMATLTGSHGSVHVEHTVADEWPDRASFWFFIQTPDTVDGNPKLITEGVIRRRDPKEG